MREDTAHTSTQVPRPTHAIDGLCWEKEINEKENKVQYFLMNSTQATAVWAHVCPCLCGMEHF